MEELRCVCTQRKLESFLKYLVKGLSICYVVKKWDQTGKLGEENNLKVLNVTKHCGKYGLQTGQQEDKQP